MLDSEKASKYGSKKCYHSLDGFKRMIDAINYFNTSNAMDIKSIIFTGGATAPVPETMSSARTISANTEIYKYLREKNPVIGIYNTIGPTDLFPPNYQLLTGSGNPVLSALNTAINPSTNAASYTSNSDQSSYISKFNEYGYYTVDGNFIHSNRRSSSYTNQAAEAKTKSNLMVIFLNTNVCHNKNLALMREKDDPGGMLNYLST